MPKVYWNGSVWLFWCPACAAHHWFDSRWEFDGDVEEPTVRPSILVPSGGCHLYLSGGVISYLPDCGHSLAGKSVECPPLV